MHREAIQIRDPFILPVPAMRKYYLFGTTDKNCWRGPGEGFDYYYSADLNAWNGPFPAFRPDSRFWGVTNFWAPEVHCWQGRYYMFASFKAPQRYRGTQILGADQPSGPYTPLTDGPITPPDWQCLDGTLYVDLDGQPWIVFCHEWVQVHNGAIYALPLSSDLTRAVGRPLFLFTASESPWVARAAWPEQDPKFGFPNYVTDGPFLFQTSTGTLLMLWSSLGAQGYAMGLARSTTGLLVGPWEHEREPIWGQNGGHGMIFKSFDGRLYLTLHTPNETPNERPVFIELEDLGHTVRVKGAEC
jgi:arabinan endo-1,5-alpha-L-arabinosidase